MTINGDVTRMRIALASLMALLVVPACSVNAPDLPNRPYNWQSGVDYPALAPIETILGTEVPDPETDARTTDVLEARVANLQARANNLQGTSGIDSETRNRLARPESTD